MRTRRGAQVTGHTKSACKSRARNETNMKIVNHASRICLCLWRLSLLFVLSICGANAAQYLDFTYETEGTNVAITEYTGNDFWVTIPDTIEGLPVTKTGDLLFAYCTNLANVTIPDTVTTMGWGTFAFCSSLTSVTIPDSVTFMREGTFHNCTSLTNVTISTNLTSKWFDTFGNCARLKSVTIPHGVTFIGWATFSGCSSLTNVVIPDTVTTLEQSVFWGCASLTNLAIPSSVRSIAAGVFFGCSALRSLTIPAGVTSIEDMTFFGCTNLASVYFQGDAPKVGNGVFTDDNELTVYYRYGTKGWGSTFASRPAQPMPLPPVIESPLDLGVVLEGKAVEIMTQIAGWPAMNYQWFVNGRPVVGATNEIFVIPSASALDAGGYMVIASNALGTVTNGPVTLGVNNVAASNFVGLVMTDPSGTPLQIQSAAQIQGPWTRLAELTLTNSPSVFIDFSATNARQRFYRTTQPGHLDVWLFPGWTFTAAAGGQQKIEYVNAEVGFNNWQFLTNLTVPGSPYLFIDTSATNKWQRFYRTTPLP